MCRFMRTQSAAFYLRTAPIIDKNFKLKYQGQSEIKLSREIALGVRKYAQGNDEENREDYEGNQLWKLQEWWLIKLTVSLMLPL